MNEPVVQAVMDTPIANVAAVPGLPFTFAQQYGVLLDAAEDGSPVVVHAGRPQVLVLTELRRILGRSFTLHDVSESDFKRRLTLAYQRNNNEAVQMAEDIGADVDLSRLADAIPDSGDLMDTEDDAPIIRLLDTAAGQLELTQLAMNTQVLAAYKKHLHSPHGIILVTGPTGSGKTTTLYAGLGDINESSRNILTIEDPVEYMLPGIGQTQVNAKVDMTFARGLRAILRQDPDVVMVGEIRDRETAEIAVQASLTGHLVLSTLHTNTAIGAITRLKDMGIEPFLLSSSLIAVMSQRLVRLLCLDCKEPAELNPAERELLGIGSGEGHQSVCQAKGCENCKYTGYRGRTGIYEIIEIDDAMRQMIYSGANEQDILHLARQHYPGIETDGRRRIMAGETSIEEVMRVTSIV